MDDLPGENVNFLYKTMVERDPKKRKVKPVQNPLLDFDLGESSDDSDFRIEDHAKESDDDDSIGSEEEGGAAGREDAESEGTEEDSDMEEGEEEASPQLKVPPGAADSPSVGQLLHQAEMQRRTSGAALGAEKVLVCCACLGQRSDSINEIVECDGCGATVHEACYGVSDTASVSSTVSSCSTEPWFCEACKAGVTDPDCELCPNHGGIFKETDVGKWVHLVCALYVPGVAFGEVDKLSNVTLFEMPYTKWGAKSCQLCEDEKLVRTGVCIGCDAGMCRVVFHVTCAQREGLLAETHCDELEHADPFYAHCRMHTDKVHMRRRRRNWLSLQLRMSQRRADMEKHNIQESQEQQRIRRKLASHRNKYLAHKTTRPQPWVPTQKMPRLLTTSASACTKLQRKATLMGVDCQALETQEAQVASLIDVRKKWHIPPAFSVEFIGYYLDRNVRITAMKRRLEDSLKTNAQYLRQQQNLRFRYDQLSQERQELVRFYEHLMSSLRGQKQAILAVCPGKRLPPEPCTAPLPPQTQPAVPAVPLVKKEQKHHRSDALTLSECGICRQSRDQHLLAKCDTCHRFYHLGCLNPPLSRMPKKTKLMGWQCSECDKETSGSEPECPDPEAPRKLRHSQGEHPIFNKHPDCETSFPSFSRHHRTPPAEAASTTRAPVTSLVAAPTQTSLLTPSVVPQQQQAMVPALVLPASRLSTEKRRHKHRGADGEKVHKRRRKKKHLEKPRIKITIKPILPPADLMEGQQQQQQQMFVASTTPTVVIGTLPQVVITPLPSPRATPPTPAKKTNRVEVDQMTKCDTCLTEGTNYNLVRCDECRKCFHFHCLDPPVKKSPKRRGYSWHCADCDPTDTDSNKG